MKWLLRVTQVTPDNCPKLERPYIPSLLPETYPFLTQGTWALPSLGTVYGIDPADDNP